MEITLETFRVNNAYRSWTTLDKTVRALEAKYGWKHTPGLTSWDKDAGQAVDIKYSDRYAKHRKEGKATAGAAQHEQYSDTESLQSYIRKEVAPEVKKFCKDQVCSGRIYTRCFPVLISN